MLRQETESLIVNQANELWTTDKTWSNDFSKVKVYGSWGDADKAIKYYQRKGNAEFSGARSLSMEEYSLMQWIAPRGEAQRQDGIRGLAFFVGADSANSYWHVFALRGHWVLGDKPNYMRSFACTAEEAAQAFADEIAGEIL